MNNSIVIISDLINFFSCRGVSRGSCGCCCSSSNSSSSTTSSNISSNINEIPHPLLTISQSALAH